MAITSIRVTFVERPFVDPSLVRWLKPSSLHGEPQHWAAECYWTGNKQQGRKSRFWTQSRGGGWFKWFSCSKSFCVICLASKCCFSGVVYVSWSLNYLEYVGLSPLSHYIYSNSDPQDDQLHLYCVGFQPEPSRFKKKHDRERLDPTLPEFVWPLLWSVYGLIDTIYPGDFGGFWVFFGISSSNRKKIYRSLTP